MTDFTRTKAALYDYDMFMEWLASVECSAGVSYERLCEVHKLMANVAENFARDTGQDVEHVRQAFSRGDIGSIRHAVSYNVNNPSH